MNISLAGLGWIDDCEPHGNRLRWSYPFDEVVRPGKYLGLPHTFTVERALLHEDLWQPPPTQAPDGGIVTGVSLPYPVTWWSAPINLQLSDWFTLYRLNQPAQAIRFSYRGPKTRVRIKDTVSRRLLADRPIANGDSFFFAAARIDEISFLPLSPTVYLDNLSVLDLFADHGLPWEEIATLEVGEMVNQRVELVDVAARCITPPTLTAKQWRELIDLAGEASVSKPSTKPPEPLDLRAEPPVKESNALTKWQTMTLLLGLRWEFACLAGFGYVDGPRADVSPLDHIRLDRALGQMPHGPVAYRVRCSERGVEASNVVVCPPYPAGPLAAPGMPVYGNPQGRLADKGEILATTELEWVQHDFNAIAAEVEQEIGPSAAKQTTASASSVEYRSFDPQDPPYTNRLSRRFTVPWHDVTLSARARALDGWDRRSLFSAWSTPVPLDLRHAPFPPPLASAQYVNGLVTLTRQSASAGVPAWKPDPIVQAAQGKVLIYRRDASKPIKTASVKVGAPMPCDDGATYRAALTPDAPAAFQPADYANGVLVVGSMRLQVSGLTANEVTFELTEDASQQTSAFAPGQGVLYQDSRDDSLWLQVHSLPVNGLAKKIKFAEPLPFPTGQADVLQYAARLSFLGRLGPWGNIVSDVRIPPAPNVPPPFTVELQGVDFYDRTLVKIKLTNPVVQGALCQVWWAPGDFTQSTSEFSGKAVAGLNGAQTAQNGCYLYDTLPLPMAKSTHELIKPLTIGVQQVNGAGGGGEFRVVAIK